MLPSDPIFIAGHRGLVGAALVRALQARGFHNLLTRTRHELDLTNQLAVEDFFAQFRPLYVFLAAARVGGILANDTRPADFLLENLQETQTNVMDAARRHGAARLLFLGSSCIYPKLAPQPIPEDALLSGPLEPTNQWYAIAKIAGLRLGQALWRQHGFPVISLMPTNLYGPNDNFDPRSSHVLPALLRKFHSAKTSGAGQVILWGTGTPLREFLHVDDLADACLHLILNYHSQEPINVGSGEEVSILELAELIRQVTGCTARLEFDSSKPDGTQRKLLNSDRLRSLGWAPRIPLREGIASTYDWCLRTGALR